MTPEGRIKKELRRYLSDIGAFWSNVQGGPGSKPGDPDMVICYEGRYIGIEAKTRDGKQSEIQRLRQGEIQRAGGLYWVIRSLDELKERIKEIQCQSK